jgi:hypothetical protein
VLVISALAWVRCSCLWSGRALGDQVAIPFLRDIETHVRFLVIVPLLIGQARVPAGARRRATVPARDLIPPHERSRFDAIASTMRLRGSIAAEVALIAGLWEAF